eukprot:TRINITY_DN65457_c0_g1_i1.p1 TRINITY_DN65457_c0_g1~~TRINITY_DN65457_c0_g1_i1.p1  ORF type:complete len:401 (+),score=141.20 TRINITY_DN65457_c0_g1_i1:87-1289(+)
MAPNATELAATASAALEKVQGITSADIARAAQTPQTYSLVLIILLAVWTCWKGAKRSPSKHDLAIAAVGVEAAGKKEDEDDQQITRKEAMLFPFVGSAVLLILYVTYKFVPQDIANTIISLNILGTSTYAVARLLRSVLHSPIPSISSGVLGGLVAVALSVTWWFTRWFVITDIICIGLCISAIEVIKLPNFTTASIMLWGLFIYDIWWVFGTEVMVSVARKVEAPMLIKLPRNFLEYPYEAKNMTMLGLGDIVIPGFFIALCYRYDLHCYLTQVKSGKRAPGERWSTPCFNTTIVAYFLSLVCAMFVMIFFEHAQPALLYIVPWCHFSVLIAGLVRGEFWQLVEYEEDEGEGDEEEKTEPLSWGDTIYNWAAELFGWELRKAAPARTASTRAQKEKKDQ